MYTSPYYYRSMVQPVPGWQVGAPYIGQETVRQIILSAWNGGQRGEDILSDCADFLSRSEMAFAELLVDELERHYQPSEIEVQAYLQKIKKVFRSNPSSQALQKLADATTNLTLKAKAQKAVDVLKQAELSGQIVAGGKTLELGNVVEQVLAERLSTLIFGNSGSGKSSVAKLIISELSHSPHITGGKSAEVLILDHHINDWGNFPLVYKQEDILRSLHIFCLELKRRQLEWAWRVTHLPLAQRKKDWPYIIVGWDEVGGTIAYADSPRGKELINDEKLIHPSEALLILGSELRKFRGMLIGMPHSQNTEALGIDSNYRNNFLRVDLCKSALNQIKQWNTDSPEYKFIKAREKGYPCLVNGVPSLHPTHYHYEIFQDDQPPAEIREPNLSPLSLSLPYQPIAYNGDIDKTFCGSVKPLEEIVDYYEKLFEGYESSDSVGNTSKPVQIQNSLNNSLVLEEDDEDFLLEAFLDIKKYRSQSSPLTKTQICALWKGKTERKHKRYDDALTKYAKTWVEEWIEKNGITPSNYKDLVELVWSKTPNRRHREEFQQCRAQLGDILTELGIDIPWQSKSDESVPANVVLLKTRG